MIFEPRIIVLRDGRQYTLRPAEPKDAAQMIAYLRTVSGETDYLLRYADEVTYTIEAEERLLENKRNNPKEVMMLAETDGVIAGCCSIMSSGTLRRISHRCGFAIALEKAYWGSGLGLAMSEYALSLAKEMGYEQAELQAVEGNTRARRLYEKTGFYETGRNPHALKYDDGTYADEICMVKMLQTD